MNCDQQCHYDNIKRIAQQHSGKLLSSTYHNRKHKLEFQCQNGHKWKAQPYSIETKWCPICLQNKKLEQLKEQKLQDIRDMLSPDLELLSNEYTPDLFTWKCHDHHISFNHDEEYYFQASLLEMEERGFQCTCNGYM
jgi:hypothetical protein